jgi:hypothetical protein
MKLIKTFEQHINERLGDVIYHFTEIKKLWGILDSDRLLAEPVVFRQDDNDARTNKGMYYISFSSTRSTRVGFPKIMDLGLYRGGLVTIVFDGRLLNAKGSGDRFDYYNNKKHRKNKEDFEYEERLFLNKPYIDKIHKYIHEIHVYSHHSSFPHNDEQVKDIGLICAKHGIPLYLYDDRHDLDNFNKAKAIDHTFSGDIRSFEYGFSGYDSDLREQIVLLMGYVIGFILYNSPNVGKWKKRIKNILINSQEIKYYREVIIKDGPMGSAEWADGFIKESVYQFNHGRIRHIEMGTVSVFEKTLESIQHFMQRSQKTGMNLDTDIAAIITDQMKHHKVNYTKDLFYLKVKKAFDTFMIDRVRPEYYPSDNVMDNA